MQRRKIANAFETSALGFGCVTLTLHNDRRNAVKGLERAFELGITHFDTARLYGFGQSETILGEFLRGKRDRVTVGTKFGFQHNTVIAKQKQLVSAARWLARRVPLIRSLAHRAVRSSSSQRNFTTADATRSLETSLKELGTDYIDLFLLHEATVEDARQEDLIALLEQEVGKGRIRSFGVASSFDKLRGDANLFAKNYAVLQFDSNALTPHASALKNAEGRSLITFGSVASARELAAVAQRDPALQRRYRDRVGADLADPGRVAALMMATALAHNPHGIVLFGTVSEGHLRANVDAAEARLSPEQQKAFEGFTAEAAVTLRKAAVAATA